MMAGIALISVRKKRLVFITILTACLIMALGFLGRFYGPRLFITYLNKQYDSEVHAHAVSWNGKNMFRAEGVTIDNKKGLRCSIEEMVILYDLFSMAREGLNATIKLRDVRLMGDGDGIVGSISSALSLAESDLDTVDSLSARIYKKGGHLKVKGLSATGRRFHLFSDTTLIDGDRIDCSIMLFLSNELVSSIPEQTRKVFFRQDNPSLSIKIHIGGEIRHPSISILTDLFQFTLQ